MLVMVKCVVYDGRRSQTSASEATPRITHVREGQVLGAWRAVDGRVGYALLEVTAMPMIANLLRAAFPDARHVDVDEVLAVESVADAVQQQRPQASGE